MKIKFNRNHIFILGILLLIVVPSQDSIRLLIRGKHATGEIVGYNSTEGYRDMNGLWVSGSNRAMVRFETENYTVKFAAYDFEENLDAPIQVIYLDADTGPMHSRVYSFTGLWGITFLICTIGIPILFAGAYSFIDAKTGFLLDFSFKPGEKRQFWPTLKTYRRSKK